MRRYDFIIAYDIADAKRLKKIAKLIEKDALRIQYSIYFYHDSTQEEVTKLLEKVSKIYDEKKDDIRVYKIKNRGLHLGCAIDLDNPFEFI